MSVTECGQTLRTVVNGIDLKALTAFMGEIEKVPVKGIVEFRVTSQWKGQTRTRATVESYSLGGRRVERRFAINADEPFELLGKDTAPNPQELLMSALNACVAVGYVLAAAVKGIALERLEVETKGQLDLRGFLGLDATVRPGYEKIYYTRTHKG